MKQWTYAERVATEKVVGVALAEGGGSFTQRVLREELEKVWVAIHDAVRAEIGEATEVADEEKDARLRAEADNVWRGLRLANQQGATRAWKPGEYDATVIQSNDTDRYVDIRVDTRRSHVPMKHGDQLTIQVEWPEDEGYGGDPCPPWELQRIRTRIGMAGNSPCSPPNMAFDVEVENPNSSNPV